MKNKRDYKEIILKTIMVAGVLSVALVAPNALQMFSFLKKDKSRSFYRIKTKVDDLLAKGLIRRTANGLELTHNGNLEFLKYTEFKFKKPKIWNGKWSVISFDFPNKKRKHRDLLRFHLKRIGFVKLQHSIWVFPYECEEVIELIKINMNLKNEVVYIRAGSISNEMFLKKLFNL